MIRVAVIVLLSSLAVVATAAAVLSYTPIGHRLLIPNRTFALPCPGPDTLRLDVVALYGEFYLDWFTAGAGYSDQR